MADKITVNVKNRPFSQIIPGRKGPKETNVMIHLKDMPSKLADWLLVNLRSPTKNTVWQDIFHTATEEPGEFFLKNGGIEISAADVTVKGKQVTFTLKDKNLHGLVDGGHTFDAVMKALKYLAAAELAVGEGYVSVKILTGLTQDEVHQRSQGGNNRTKAKLSSKLNQVGYFDGIKAAMKDAVGADEINYFEGDSGKVPIADVVGRLLVFAPKYLTRNEFGSFDSQPARLVSRGESALKEWQTMMDAGVLGPVIANTPEILQLYERIAVAVPEAWRASKPKGRGKRLYGRVLVERQKFSNDVLQKFFFIEVTKPSQGVSHYLLYALLSSFRANVDPWSRQRKSGFEWRMSNGVLIEKGLHHAIDDIAQAYESAVKNKKDSLWNTVVRDNHALLANCVERMDRIVQAEMATA